MKAKTIKESIMEYLYTNVYDIYLEPSPKRDKDIFIMLHREFKTVTFNGIGRDNLRLITVKTDKPVSDVKELLSKYIDLNIVKSIVITQE